MAIYRRGLLSCHLIMVLNVISMISADIHHQLHQQINELHRPHPKIPDVNMPHIEDISTSSIVLEQTSTKRTDLNFIHLMDPPKVYTPDQVLHVEYTCQDGDIMGVEVIASSKHKHDFLLFDIDWECMIGVGHIQTMFVKVELPDSVSYRPDYLNRRSVIITDMKYRLWVIPRRLSYLKKTSAYEMSLANSVYMVIAPLPYDRPKKTHESKGCLPWDTQILMQFRTEEVLTCDFETDVVQLIKYPVALAGAVAGITRDLPEFTSRYLITQKKKHVNNPRFTMSTLIYIVDYCKQQLCSIFHRKTHFSNKYVTPIMFLNPKGEVHIQVVQNNGQASSMLSNYQLPKHEWIRVVFSQHGKTWKLHMSHKKGFSKTITATADFSRPIQLNDTDGLIHLGGSQSVASFRGYMAETKIWRNRVLNNKQIPFPSLTEDMYLVGIEDSYKKCLKFTSKMEQVFDVYRAQKDWVVKQKSCPYTLNSIFGLESPYFPPKPYCRLWGRRPPRSQQLLWTALKHGAVAGRVYNQSFSVIGKALYDGATGRLIEGMTVVPKIIPILKQASCYDNNQASYMLSTLYSGGVGISPDKYKGIMYQMKAAEGDYQPALCAMGDKHQFGQEGVPQDYDYAFNYLKNVADRTVKDKEKHDSDGVFTEMVRLTDTDALQHQTGEKGDYFLWMKYQAKKGLAEAQINLARMLFWGQHGVTRDLPLAIEYFNEYLANNPADPLANYDMAVILLRSTVARLTFWGQGGVKRDIQTAVRYYAMTAREAPRNPVGLYDYGIVLLRGQGTAKNVTKALNHLNRSAELGHAPAYTALGWYALNHEKNITKAVKYFEKADKMGHRDAAHNLGYLYRVGKYPNHTADEVMAFKFYYKAAQAGHIDSGVMVAEMHNQGNKEMPRSSAHAVLWARFIAEQNSEMGRILRKGLDAYLQGSWAESLIYYMMAAEAGVEVAQFNLAYLCEEDHENIAASYVHADCIWKYYNKSSNSNQPPVLAQLKMGDYHWYGYQGANDTEKAVNFYGKAALQKDPQAIFNLGYIVEQGVEMKPSLLKSLGINTSVINSTDRRIIAMELYRKCRDHSNKDAYVPCGLAVLRLQWQELWIKHTFFMKVTSAILFGLMSSLTIATCLTHIRGYESSVENV